MNLLWPWFLLLLLLIPLLIAVYIWILRRKRRFAVRYSTLSLIREALPKRSRLRQHLPFALFLLAVASLTGIAEPGKLVSGNFASGLDARVSKTGNKLNVVLQPQHHSFPDVFFPGNWIGGKGLSWEFGLSNELPLDLVFEVGAVDAHLDLTDLLVKNISLQTGASSTNLKLPAAAGTTYLKVEAGAASIDIQVPESVAARVETSAGLASINVDQTRFPKQGGVYQSVDYEKAENKVDIRIETGVSSIQIH